MIQKVSRAKDRTVPPNSTHQVDVGKVLPIQLDPIHAREVHPVLSQHPEQIVDARLVRRVSRLQSLPSKGLGSLTSELQLKRRAHAGVGLGDYMVRIGGEGR